MTKWRYFDFACESCGHVRNEVMFDTDTEEVKATCECGTAMVRLFPCPALMQHALPDGTNRGMDFDKLKEKADLEITKADCMHEADRKSVQKEIDKLGV